MRGFCNSFGLPAARVPWSVRLRIPHGSFMRVLCGCRVQGVLQGPRQLPILFWGFLNIGIV